MNKTHLMILTFALLQGPSALAAEGGNKAQTTRMSQCSAEAKAKGMKGDERKEHMSQCLRNPGAQAAAKACNADAKEQGLKGEQRKAFVSECVKNKANSANSVNNASAG